MYSPLDHVPVPNEPRSVLCLMRIASLYVCQYKIVYFAVNIPLMLSHSRYLISMIQLDIAERDTYARNDWDSFVNYASVDILGYLNCDIYSFCL